MNKKRNDGIVFDNTVYLSEDYYKKFPLYMRLLQAFVIFIGSYCFMTIFTGTFDLVFINSRLIWAIIISATILSALLLYPRYDFIKFILILTLYGAIIYNWYEQLQNGFFLLENAIIKRASIYYGFTEFSFIADQRTADRDITLLLILIIIPLVAILTLSLLRNKCKLLCYIVMLLPVIVSFAMGLTPPEVDLIAYILVFLFILISNSFSYSKFSSHNTFSSVQDNMVYRISIRSAYMFCLSVFLLFFIIKQFVPIERYKDYEGIYETKTKIQSFMTDFSNYNISDKLWDFKWNIRPSRIASSGGLNLGKLGRVDQVSFDETEHLQITVPLQSVIEGIYLKGYIGSEYTGDSWETHSRQTRKSYDEMMANISQEDYDPAIGSAVLLSHNPYRAYVNQGRIDIRYTNARQNYIYTPYFTIFEENDGVSFNYDLAAVSDKDMRVETYEYSYNLSEIMEHSDYDLASALGYILDDEEAYIDGYSAYILLDYSENESKYRDFVYKTYTKLPEKGLERLKHDFSREQVGPPSENIQDAVDYVKDYLNRFTRYNLSPGRLPRGKDFVEYFLYENKIGYCSHFASAGALMLRAMGYPSRYVEGYAINRSDLMNQVMTSYIGDEINTAEIIVKDSNAHAWVEVYIDGFGWIPVEFTTGSGMEDMIDSIGDLGQFGQGGTNEVPAMPTDTPPSPTSLPPNEEMDQPAPASDLDEDIKGSGLLKENDDNPQIGFRWYFIVVILLVLSTSIILIWMLMSKHNKDMTEESYSNRALELYKRVERLLIINNGLPKKSKSLEENEEYARKHLAPVLVNDFEACMDMVRKARFDKESISQKEYMIVESFYKTLRDKS